MGRLLVLHLSQLLNHVFTAMLIAPIYLKTKVLQVIFNYTNQEACLDFGAEVLEYLVLVSL